MRPQLTNKVLMQRCSSTYLHRSLLDSTTLRPKIFPTLLRPAKTFRHPLLRFPVFHLLTLLRILIIKRQLGIRLDVVFRKERQIIHLGVPIVIGDGKLATIRLARMIHEPRRPTHVFAVDDIEIFVRDAVACGELVHRVEVAVFSFVILLAFVGLGARDDFATVGVYELSISQ